MAIPRARLTTGDRGTRRIVALRGGAELRARLEAASMTFIDVAVRWQDEAIKAGTPRIPSRTGATRRSLRAVPVGAKTMNAGGKRAARLQARVEGSYVGYFIDSGVGEHGPKKARAMRYQGGEGTIFAKKVRGYKKRPFRARMAREGLRNTPMAQLLIDRWNGAA
jgi:hypothetical protein